MCMTKNIVMVVGAFHRARAEVMVDEAMRTAREAGICVKKVIWVPGSLEKPLALRMFLSKKDIDGAVVLGIIEKGQTKHGLVMGHAVIDAIIRLQLDFQKPIGVGILGPEIRTEQMKPRLKPYARGAVLAVKSMFEVMDSV